jgi:hypothetical protein
MALKVESIQDNWEGETIKKLIVSLAAVAFVALMVGFVFAQCEPTPPPCTPTPPPCTPTPPPCDGGLSPGFWKHNLAVYFGDSTGSYSDPVGATNVDKDSMGTWLAGLSVDLGQLYIDLSTKGGGAAGAATRVDAANILNDLAGLGPYIDMD